MFQGHNGGLHHTTLRVIGVLRPGVQCPGLTGKKFAVLHTAPQCIGQEKALTAQQPGGFLRSGVHHAKGDGVGLTLIYAALGYECVSWKWTVWHPCGC